MAERIPIPTDRAQARRPIHLEFTPQAFPGQRFAIRMDWNNHLEKWIVEIEHLRREFRVTKATATPYRPYSYMPYLVFVFFDPTGTETEITPSNLGDGMNLYVLAGPSGRDPGED
ncbi:uncharacterized protein ChaoS9_110 [Halobacterium phage ChaoS9]|uniref:Cyanophage baseplate Pam3 plug gp18 domain-containing protein n=1 Tax=Halobacterium phage ChaoS9 TaxID=2847105 RepID=A0A481V8E7_9CAUD|nr:uncharacterized protein KMC41_gp23 [Halobacterium phage ChaoS9]QBI90029.1 uncharacterized protein ChaoS9_110 [Halobacterium phage ChaoS9]